MGAEAVDGCSVTDSDVSQRAAPRTFSTAETRRRKPFGPRQGRPLPRQVAPCTGLVLLPLAIALGVTKRTDGGTCVFGVTDAPVAEPSCCQLTA